MYGQDYDDRLPVGLTQGNPLLNVVRAFGRMQNREVFTALRCACWELTTRC